MYKYVFGMMLCAGIVVSTVPGYKEMDLMEQVAYHLIYPLPVGDFMYSEYVRNQAE